MGLCYETSKWADRLWGEHLETSEQGRTLVKEGIKKQGDAFAGFPADLHARLYLPIEPTTKESAPEWAGRLHDMSRELGEWHSLKLMTARNGFAAGVAAEAMLKVLLPHVPERPEGQSGDGGGEDGSVVSDTDVRTALRKAARSARDAVQDAESALEGLGPGTGMGTDGRMNLKAVREAHERLKSSPRLKEIAKLAGRFERITASKIRSKVNPGVGEVHGIGLGDDISRLLPSELMYLLNPSWERVLFARLQEKRALVYAMRGKEPQGKGPIVILLDESGSMRDDGRDIWSKAVALAVTNRAMREKRAVYIVGFTGKIEREVLIEPGAGTPALIQDALDHECSGGTNFDRPIRRACNIIQRSKVMKNADVLMITDGEREVSDVVATGAQELTKTEGVSWFIVGVGPEAIRTVPHTLGPIATSIHLVNRTDEGDCVADIVALRREAS